ncbi:protein of unknown function [Clostridium beijerinckii]|nr:protein of unknown function [Clostridium beijerinckii]
MNETGFTAIAKIQGDSQCIMMIFFTVRIVCRKIFVHFLMNK